MFLQAEAVFLRAVPVHVSSQHRCCFAPSLPHRVRTPSPPGAALSSSSPVRLLHQAPARRLGQLPVSSQAVGWLVPVAQSGGKTKQGVCSWFTSPCCPHPIFARRRAARAQSQSPCLHRDRACYPQVTARVWDWNRILGARVGSSKNVCSKCIK